MLIRKYMRTTIQTMDFSSMHRLCFTINNSNELIFVQSAWDNTGQLTAENQAPSRLRGQRSCCAIFTHQAPQACKDSIFEICQWTWCEDLLLCSFFSLSLDTFLESCSENMKSRFSLHSLDNVTDMFHYSLKFYKIKTVVVAAIVSLSSFSFSSFLTWRF